MNVLLQGGGVAAACCAQLLGRQGIGVTTRHMGHGAAPFVMLSDTARALLRDVLSQPDLFAGHPRIDRRGVAWGADPVVMPHAATIVSGAALAAALEPHVRTGPMDEPTDPVDFTLFATSPLPAGSAMRFGARPAVATEARLSNPDDRGLCWIEALDIGWLFLIPCGGDRAWLLCVGAAPVDMLDRSRHIAPRIADTDGPFQHFDPVPRIATHIAGAGWLGCGTATIAFDPLCGDGTAHAVREAILASAVIAAIAKGGDAAALSGHYQAMLIAAMRRHLQLAMPFYRTGGKGEWWRDAQDALAQGHDWCTQRLATTPEPRYMLRGDALVEREHAA